MLHVCPDGVAIASVGEGFWCALRFSCCRIALEVACPPLRAHGYGHRLGGAALEAGSCVVKNSSCECMLLCAHQAGPPSGSALDRRFDARTLAARCAGLMSLPGSGWCRCIWFCFCFCFCLFVATGYSVCARVPHGAVIVFDLALQLCNVDLSACCAFVVVVQRRTPVAPLRTLRACRSNIDGINTMHVHKAARTGQVQPSCVVALTETLSICTSRA